MIGSRRYHGYWVVWVTLGVHCCWAVQQGSSSSSSYGSVPGSVAPPDYWWSSDDDNDDDGGGGGGGGGDSSSDWEWVEDPDEPVFSSSSIISSSLSPPPPPPPQPLVIVSLDPSVKPSSATTTTTATVVFVDEKTRSAVAFNTLSNAAAPAATTTTTATSPPHTNTKIRVDEPDPTVSASNDDADTSTADESRTIVDISSNKPLQTLEKLQHMLDETDYLTTSRASQEHHQQHQFPPTTTTVSSTTIPSLEDSNDASSSAELSLPATKSLWTSKDRSKYKRQQRNARASTGAAATSTSTTTTATRSSTNNNSRNASTRSPPRIPTPQVGSLQSSTTTATTQTSVPQQQLQSQQRQQQNHSVLATPSIGNPTPRRQYGQMSWPPISPSVALDAAVVSSSDLVEDPSDTDDGLGYTLPNLPVYLSDDEGDPYSEGGAAAAAAAGFSAEDVAAASARAAAAATTYPQQQHHQFQNPAFLQQQQQQPGPPIVYPGYHYGTNAPPQWATTTSPQPYGGYYPPPHMHSQQPYYLPPPESQGLYPPPNTNAMGHPPPGYFYPQRLIPATPTYNTRYSSRIPIRESSSSYYYDPRREREETISSNADQARPSTAGNNDNGMTLERPPTNSDSGYHHSMLPVDALATVTAPMQDWQYPSAPLTRQFRRALGALTQVSMCLILSAVVCYAAVSPHTLPFLEYNQQFYEICRIASLACIPPLVVSVMVVDRATNQVPCLVNGFYSAFTLGYVITFGLEIVAATVTRLAVFAVWEPRVYDMTPQVPLVMVPWVLRDQRYLVKPITLIVQDLVTSVVMCPLMEEWIKLVIFKAVIPRGRNFAWVRKPSRSNPKRRKWVAEPVSASVPDASLQVPGGVVNVNHYVSGMLAVSVGLKLADSIRRTCMYTKAGDANKGFYAFCRGIFPIQELCGTVTALGLARRDVLGQKQPLWKLLLPAVIIHGMANFRGMKPIFKWNSATPWTEMQLSPHFYTEGASLAELASKAFPKVMWLIILFRVAGYCVKNYYMINRQAVKRTTTYAGNHAAFSAELAAAEMLKKNSKEK